MTNRGKNIYKRWRARCAAVVNEISIFISQFDFLFKERSLHYQKMIDFTVGTINVRLFQEREYVYVVSPGDKIKLANQTIEQVEEQVKMDFAKVYRHYAQVLEKRTDVTIAQFDLCALCLKIELHYLYMHNMWRNQYKTPHYDDLSFKDDDYESPSTYDIIFFFYKSKGLINWQEMCANLLEVSFEQFTELYRKRELYYNK